MPQREWTGSVSVLPESIRNLAIEMANLSRTNDPGAMAEFLTDHAYTLSEWADAVEQLYVRRDAPAGKFTNAQALEVGKIALRALNATVFPEPFDLPDGYVFVCTDDRRGVVNAQYGIAPDGSVST